MERRWSSSSQIRDNVAALLAAIEFDVIEIDGEIVTVKVGEAPHPMLEEHYIQWICLHTEKGLQFVNLKPGDAPEAVFALAPDDAVIEAFDYCNIHGLWVSKL